MNNIFDFKRIGLMLKADILEYKKSFLLFSGLLFLAFLAIFWKADETGKIALFIIGNTIALVSYYNLVGRKIHRSRSQFLMLPASTFEKFVEILLLGIAYLAISSIIYILALLLSNLFFKSGLMDINQILGNSFLPALAFSFFLSSFLLLSYITFRKYALGIGVASLMFILFSFLGIYAFLLNNIIQDYEWAFIFLDTIQNTLMFLQKYSSLFMTVSGIVLLYVSYVKLKEKQIK